MSGVKVWKMQVEKSVSKDIANDIKLYFKDNSEVKQWGKVNQARE